VTPLRVLSLGAGVQSSTLALMMAKGEFPPCDHAIFADTQCEPQAVYDYLAYLTPLLPFPVHIVSAGNLGEDFLKALDDPNGRAGQPPFMALDAATGEPGRLWRKCTTEYKIDPIKRRIAKLRAKRQPVEQIIGISLDEAHRMKPARVKYIRNVYPLVEMRMNRHDCLQWLKRSGYRTPPKSACWFCPYMSNARLRSMRDTTPEEWGKLVAFDNDMRKRQRETVNGAKITGTLYVHRDCKPISEIDLSTDRDRGQGDLFGNECEGMCGL
jgi:hypothetical protein